MPESNDFPDIERIRNFRPRFRRGPVGVVGWLMLAGAVVVAGVAYVWFVQRVEVGPGEVLILVRKVGNDLPPDSAGAQTVLYPELLTQLGADAKSTTYKGVVFEPRIQGRHFYDPFFWQRTVVPAVEIRSDEIGILIRKYGRPLPPGQLVATAGDERGPLAEPLKPGLYNLNPFAFDVKRVKPVQIPAGHVGIQTLYLGKESQHPNEYVVADGERGVQTTVLSPGLYYNNPYVRRIDVIDVRSHTIDLHGESDIRFPSNDSFAISVDCTVEYAIRQDMAAYVMVAIGDHDDVRDKLILPYARSLCRIEGSKLLARDFISGESRTAFQTRVFEGLRDQCYAQGVEIRSTLIRQIIPPAEIAGPISDRQLADQQIKQYQNDIKVAESESKLAEQQEMQSQNQALGEVNREIVGVVKEAEQRRSVAVTEARQRLEVAKLALESARQNAEATLARGQADAEIRRLKFEAETTPLAAAVAAFGGGEEYAQFFFYQRLGPAIRSVLTSTEGPFADVFRALAKPSEAGPPARRIAAQEPPGVEVDRTRIGAGGEQ